MKDFDRIDSEDDLLGEFGDCMERTKCIRNRTMMEKLMVLALAALIIIIIALAIVLAKQKDTIGMQNFHAQVFKNDNKCCL